LRSHAAAPDLPARWKRAIVAAGRAAADDRMPVRTREAALGLMGRPGGPNVETEFLCDLVAEDGVLRDAAMAALRRQIKPETADLLLARWRRTSPAARPAVVELLLSRSEWTLKLLESVAAGRIRSHEVPLQTQDRLRQGRDERVRDLAAKAFPARPTGDRDELIGRYQSALKEKGRAEEGAKVFEANCAACHPLAGVGHPVGPDLASMRGKEPDYLLKNILDPSAVVEPRFLNYQIVLKNRRSLAGVISAESDATLTLEYGSGVSETVARSAIAEIRATDTSMMPEGFESAITPSQMADLIAFLKAPAGK
jgi:putative heme-binding domain-containing protein